MENDNDIYCENKLRDTIENLMFDLLTSRPRDLIGYSIEWLRKKGNYTASGLKSEEKQELESIKENFELKQVKVLVNSLYNFSFRLLIHNYRLKGNH